MEENGTAWSCAQISSDSSKHADGCAIDEGTAILIAADYVYWSKNKGVWHFNTRE